MKVTIHEAKTHLSKLIAAVERGEEVVIARRDKAVVRIVKEQPAAPRNVLGCLLMPGQAPPNLEGFFDKDLEDDIAQDFYPELSKHEWNTIGKQSP
ncbi:MAG: type II toxin-antitoxin system prevent-host-death family antitoxin [Verrucomicrobia bacterium]|nr:MAG: type II toxin-antitoxin system prevent-host-death family antitoxin [Verrucomicrobiota bacterium]